jgi:hypothetical protein
MGKKEDLEKLHRAKLKHFLSIDELTLPDVKREELLLQRELLSRGLLRDMDLCTNMESIEKAARESAFSRNNFTFWSWLETVPLWLQVVLCIGGIFLILFIIFIFHSSSKPPSYF